MLQVDTAIGTPSTLTIFDQRTSPADLPTTRDFQELCPLIALASRQPSRLQFDSEFERLVVQIDRPSKKRHCVRTPPYHRNPSSHVDYFSNGHAALRTNQTSHPWQTKMGADLSTPIKEFSFVPGAV
jgi:hypothetical protein